ncbi:hypothetical protein [Sphingomonas melonis]
MLHLYDHTTIAHVMALNIEPELRALLTVRIAALKTAAFDLTDCTEFLVVDDPGDSEQDIVRHIGQSPLIEPIDGLRFGSPDFHPHWDYLTRHSGWFEMILTFGSAFAYVLFVKDADDILPELVTMCRYYA